MSDKETLYKVEVQTPVSPEELRDFTIALEREGYLVVTDLEHGQIEIRDTAEGYNE